MRARQISKHAIYWKPSARDGDKAGIIAFQNELYDYLLSAARVAGSTVVRLEKHDRARADTDVACRRSETIRGHHAGPLRDNRTMTIAGGTTHLEPIE